MSYGYSYEASYDGTRTSNCIMEPVAIPGSLGRLARSEESDVWEYGDRGPSNEILGDMGSL